MRAAARVFSRLLQRALVEHLLVGVLAGVSALCRVGRIGLGERVSAPHGASSCPVRDVFRHEPGHPCGWPGSTFWSSFPGYAPVNSTASDKGGRSSNTRRPRISLLEKVAIDGGIGPTAAVLPARTDVVVFLSSTPSSSIHAGSNSCASSFGAAQPNMSQHCLLWIIV